MDAVEKSISATAVVLLDSSITIASIATCGVGECATLSKMGLSLSGMASVFLCLKGCKATGKLFLLARPHS